MVCFENETTQMCLGVSAVMFVGFIVHEKGIELDAKKIESIRQVEAPT